MHPGNSCAFHYLFNIANVRSFFKFDPNCIYKINPTSSTTSLALQILNLANWLKGSDYAQLCLRPHYGMGWITWLSNKNKQT